MNENRIYPKFNIEKATESTVFLLMRHNGSMDKMKLIKLLYLSDRRALQEWEQPITFDIYYSMRQGQVLSGVLDLINNITSNQIWQKYIKNLNKIVIALRDEEPLKFRKLSRAEVLLLEEIDKEYGKMTGRELGKITKNFPEYKPTDSRERTFLEDILNAIYDEEDAARIEQQLEEKAFLELALER